MAPRAFRLKRVIFLSFVILFLVQRGSGEEEHKEKVKNIIRHFQEQYAPDERLSVFSIKVKFEDNFLEVSGEVDRVEAKKAFLDSLRRFTKMEVLDNIVVLPSPQLEEKQWGVVTLSVADVRKEPDNRKEMVTQVLMGTTVTLLKPGKLFWFVRLPDGYLGWLKRSAFVPMTTEELRQWKQSPHVIVTSYFGVIRSRPSETALPVSDVVMGCILRRIDSVDQWLEVELADKRRGFLPQSLVEDYERWKNSRTYTPDALEKTALQFLGFPYLWGGNSVKGFDCSGFVSTVFRLNGKELLRDADLQATMGVAVDEGKNFEHLKKGDLLFFGEPATKKKPEHINHVGLYLDSLVFIHCSGNVHCSSFDPRSPLYDGVLRKMFLRARRIE